MDELKTSIIAQILFSESYQWTSYEHLHLRHLLEECFMMYQGIDILGIKEGFGVTSRYLAEEILDNVDYFLVKCQLGIPRLSIFLTDLKLYTEWYLKEATA